MSVATGFAKTAGAVGDYARAVGGAVAGAAGVRKAQKLRDRMTKLYGRDIASRAFADVLMPRRRVDMKSFAAPAAILAGTLGGAALLAKATRRKKKDRFAP